MTADDDLLLAALSGKQGGSLVDQVDAALTVAWRLSSGLNLTLPVSGGSPGPYRAGGSTWDLAVDQATAQWGPAGKARTLTEKTELLEALVRGIDAKRGAIPPAPAPAPVPSSSSWMPLPVLTSKAITGERSSFQSSVPSWTADGMVVSLLAKGDRPGTPNPTQGGATQRCEAHLAGWENLTGTLFLRYDFSLGNGFPTSSSDWCALGQLKNSSTGSPPLELMVYKSNIVLQWHSASGAETGREVFGPATTGTKHSAVVQVPFTTGPNAKVTGWFNGKQVFSANHGPTLYTGQSNFGKLGCYRSNAIGVAATVTHHGVAKGATLASVT